MWRRLMRGGVLVALTVAMNGGVAEAKGHPFSTPGYHWNHKLPRVAPVIPGKLIKLGDGVEPRVLVDAAGTGQIAYNVTPTDVSAPSVLHDCVLLRGQTGCASNNGLIPPETGDPRYNIDEHGPVPLSIGNELLMLDSRFPNVETLPDGTTGYPTFLWTSEDAGKTFTGPGTIGNLEITGNAVVFGGANPQIGVITDTTSGGTLFQATPPGAFSGQTLNLGDSGPDQAYDGRLAVDGTRPIDEFQDLSNHIYVREYNGTGDIYDTSSWSRAEINGQGYSRIVERAQRRVAHVPEDLLGAAVPPAHRQRPAIGRGEPDHPQQRLRTCQLRHHRGRVRSDHRRLLRLHRERLRAVCDELERRPPLVRAPDHRAQPHRGLRPPARRRSGRRWLCRLSGTGARRVQWLPDRCRRLRLLRRHPRPGTGEPEW